MYSYVPEGASARSKLKRTLKGRKDLTIPAELPPFFFFFLCSSHYRKEFNRDTAFQGKKQKLILIKQEAKLIIYDSGVAGQNKVRSSQLHQK